MVGHAGWSRCNFRSSDIVRFVQGGVVKTFRVRQLMPEVSVQIVEFLSSDQPGFVAATLTDIDGVVHTFHDKVPIFTIAAIDADTQLPVPGWLDCTVLEAFERDGRELVRIDTEKPFDVESTTGSYRFLVAAENLTSNS